MHSIKDLLHCLKRLADPSLQEDYDNSGLITGNPTDLCTGIICCLDVTESVLDEAITNNVNLIVSHHPILFKPLKTITPTSFVEKILLKAIKNDLAIYAIHTNYDNVINGVNLALAKKIGLIESTLKILAPVSGKLAKLYTYVPIEHKELLKTALFEAGSGQIGKYHECSFETPGTGTFKPKAGSTPFIGQPGGHRENVPEVKIEVIFPVWLKHNILQALKANHPYEEVAYEIIITENEHQEIGSGMLGEMPEAMDAQHFLSFIRQKFELDVLRHSKSTGKPIKKIAICGGAGSFLLKTAIASGADAFLTADLKYHDFFEPDSKLIMIDIGHYESEIAAVAQLANYLKEKFPTFAVLQTKVDTNPVKYFVG